MTTSRPAGVHGEGPAYGQCYGIPKTVLAGGETTPHSDHAEGTPDIKPKASPLKPSVRLGSVGCRLRRWAAAAQRRDGQLRLVFADS